jgi:hypothetical protein
MVALLGIEEGYSQDHLFEVDQALTGADATGAFR